MVSCSLETFARYLCDVRVLREISEMPREKEGILFENSRENVYPSKFMRILNPLMPREVCPFRRGRLRPREFRSRSLCMSRVLANFSMSFHNSILVARTFLLKSVRFFLKRDCARRKDASYPIIRFFSVRASILDLYLGLEYFHL